jgi:hypothetical protein
LNGYTKIYSNGGAFAVIEANGSITAWGNSGYGGINTPPDSGYIKIYSNEEGAPEPPAFGSPHTAIEPLALRAAKAYIVE